jgi:predicted short-subunit dehydrogenase-like oxidoreductase (DUF2520 family)
MTRTTRTNAAIIGAGIVGLTLGRLLVENGVRITSVVSRTPKSARAGAKYLRSRSWSTTVSAIPPGTDLILITTPHGAIASVGSALAAHPSLDFRRLSVCHASGMLTADVLEPLRVKGATVFSFHPLQTFPREFKPQDILETARGIYYGVDGSAKAIRAAKRLAAKLKGRVIEIPPGMRPFYHAACVVATNHLAALLWALERMFEALGTRERRFLPVFRPIVDATVTNVGRSSPARALTGPIARGGIETVAAHLSSIKHHCPEVLPIFAQLSLETISLARTKGSIDDTRERALRNLVNSYLNDSGQLQEVR